MKTRRPLLLYIPMVALLVGVGLLSRSYPEKTPYWVTFFAGDLIWAMVVYLLFGLTFNLKPRNAVGLALVFSYSIEVSQLFHPPWLEYLRSVKVFALILGFKFLWSDLVAYTLGILLAAGIDGWIVKRAARKTGFGNAQDGVNSTRRRH